MSIVWTERQRPPVSSLEKAIRSALWRARTLALDHLAASSNFTGWKDRVYRIIARAEERWAMHVTQADLHLTRCSGCGEMKMHVIMRPGVTKWTNRKICFGCQLDTPHPSEH